MVCYTPQRQWTIEANQFPYLACTLGLLLLPFILNQNYMYAYLTVCDYPKRIFLQIIFYATKINQSSFTWGYPLNL